MAQYRMLITQRQMDIYKCAHIPTHTYLTLYLTSCPGARLLGQLHINDSCPPTLLEGHSYRFQCHVLSYLDTSASCCWKLSREGDLIPPHLWHGNSGLQSVCDFSLCREPTLRSIGFSAGKSLLRISLLYILAAIAVSDIPP